MTQKQLNDALFDALSAWAENKPGMFCAKNGSQVLIIENGSVEGTVAGQAPYHYEELCQTSDNYNYDGIPQPGHG